MHTSGETDSTCTFACGVDNAMIDFLDVLEELRLGGTRISKKQHVDITTNAVLFVDVLRLASEHGKSKALLDEFVAVDRGSNRVDQALGNVAGASCLSNLMLFFICELNNILVALSFQIVNFHDSLEDREAVLNIGEVVVAIDVDAVNFYLIARSSLIDQVVEDEDLFLAGNTTRRHCARSLLNSQLLIVTVDGLHLINSVRAIRMAHNTLGERLPSLIRISFVDGALHITADALEEHFGVLREDLSALGHDTLEFNQGV